MSNLAHSPVNDQRFKDLCTATRELARTHATGERSLPMLAGHLVRAAADGIIDSTKNKHGEADDASFLYDEYLKGYSHKAGEYHTAGGKKANKSKMRQFVKVGEMTTIDPVAEFDRWHEAFKAQAKIDPKSVRAEYAAYVEAARSQLTNSDSALSDEQVKECVLKPAKEDPDVVDVLEGIKKKLERVISGEAGVKDQHEHTIAAFEALRERLAALGTQREIDNVRAKVAELHERGIEIAA